MFAPVLFFTLVTITQPAQGTQGDYRIRDFRFTTGEVLPELRIHYTTLGTPRRDAGGTVRNAVMVLHGTGGSGRGFLSRNFGGELFGPGQLLDTARFYIVLPDNIGHGGSSKPNAADSLIQSYVTGRLRKTDANDMIYQFASSREYDPSPHLGKITTPVLAINSKDDLINPPELTFVDSLVARVKTARFINLPITPETRGHGTHSLPRIWGRHLEEFLKGLAER